MGEVDVDLDSALHVAAQAFSAYQFCVSHRANALSKASFSRSEGGRGDEAGKRSSRGVTYVFGISR